MQFQPFNKQIQTVTRLLLSVLCALLMSVTVQAGSFTGQAHDFTLKSRGGDNIRLNELAGQVVLINFWASWCGPCRKEMPKLEELHEKYKDLGVTILGINIDENSELSKKVLKDITVTFPILYDNENKVSEQYSIEAMPATFLVDRNGNFRFRHDGYKAGYEDTYDQQIKQLMRD